MPDQAIAHGQFAMKYQQRISFCLPSQISGHIHIHQYIHEYQIFCRTKYTSHKYNSNNVFYINTIFEATLLTRLLISMAYGKHAQSFIQSFSERNIQSLPVELVRTSWDQAMIFSYNIKCIHIFMGQDIFLSRQGEQMRVAGFPHENDTSLRGLFSEVSECITWLRNFGKRSLLQGGFC